MYCLLSDIRTFENLPPLNTKKLKCLGFNRLVLFERDITGRNHTHQANGPSNPRDALLEAQTAMMNNPTINLSNFQSILGRTVLGKNSLITKMLTTDVSISNLK